MGRLTTHVLDTAHGCAGAGMEISLFALAGDQRNRLATVVSNADGRCDGPLLEGDGLRVGTYELEFAAGAYFRARGVVLPEPPFVDTVVLRFGISDPAGHYHVPLLVSPWSYTTYRGS